MKDSSVIRGRDLFYKYENILEFISRLYLILPKNIRKNLLEKKQYKKGIFQIGLRYSLVKTLAKEVGENVRISEGVFLNNIQNLSIGSNVSIWPMSYIEASGGIYIGNNVSIAHSVTIMSEEHNYIDRTIPIKDQGRLYYPVIIKDNVWIGAKATILSGVTIEEGAVIGAGAVVTKDVPCNSVMVGIPAHVLKIR